MPPVTQEHVGSLVQYKEAIDILGVDMQIQKAREKEVQRSGDQQINMYIATVGALKATVDQATTSAKLDVVQHHVGPSGNVKQRQNHQLVQEVASLAKSKTPDMKVTVVGATGVNSVDIIASEKPADDIATVFQDVCLEKRTGQVLDAGTSRAIPINLRRLCPKLI